MKQNNHTGLGYKPATPPRDSAGWNRVLMRGCGGHWTPGTPSSPPDFDCSHGYHWTCDECPVGIVAMEAQAEAWAHEHQGPPRPEHMRPEGWRQGLWDSRVVDTEMSMEPAPFEFDL